MSLTAHAIRRNRVTLVALLALCGAGISAYLAMPQDENPSFVIRVAVVATYFPGASPERVEQLVTDKLEKAILEMPQIHHLSSTSKTSASIIFVEIKEEYADMEPVWKELREKVEVAKRDLPTGVIGPFVNDDFGDVYGIVISLSGDGYSAAELEDVAEELRSELLGASEVAKVEIYGKQPERVYIEYDNASIAALGFSGAALRQLLEMQNIIIPGGSLRAGDEQVVVEPSGNFSTVEDLERTVIRAPDSDALFFLGDVVDIRRGTIEPPEALVHSSAAARPCPPSSAVPGYAPQTCRRALALGVSLREGGNILELGEQVSELVQRFESRAPLGLELEFVAYQPARVVHKVGEFLTNLGQAMLLVIVIMLTALGLRTGMIVAAAVPMTVIVTVFLMSVFGVGIDQVSLAALLIALGMLVDNSIVMSESIMVQMGEGKTPFDAAVGAAAELKWPLLISSLATASAFLPIFLAQSMASEYTQSLFKVVTMCLLSSWALSLTLTPLLCVAFLRVAPRNESVYSRWPFRVYRAILGFFLRQRLLTLVLLGGGIAFSVHLGTQVPQRFFPSDRNLWFLVELELPEGSAVEATEAVVSELEAFMSEELMAQGEGDGIVSWVAFIGNGGPRFILTQNPELASPEYAILLINTATPSVAESMAKIDAFLREKPDLRFKVKEGKLGPPTKNPVSVRISTPDKELLARIGEQVARKLESIHGVRDVNDNWGVKAKKLYVDVHEESARRAGVSNLDVAL
ncbi:MAG: efflux RND transporter permease subunit, partial [Myxococcota bacterium]|nr:efflux RND transporter permease subunit [Myxococcota bacterium]